MKTYKFAVYPSKTQTGYLNGLLNSLAEVWNWDLQTRKDYYEEHGKSITRAEQSRAWSANRQTVSEHQKWSAGAQQDVLKRVHIAFSAAFERIKAGEKKAGFPRFKSQVHSITFIPGKGGGKYHPARHGLNYRRKTSLKDSTASFYILGVGHVRVHEHREVQGTIKHMTLKRSRGDWYLTIVTDYCEPVLPKTGKVVGIDMGKVVFIATSDGVKVPAPQFLKKNLPALKAAQARQAACQGGTPAKRKGGEKLSKSSRARSKIVGDLHKKIKNSREDFHKKQAKILLDAADVIYHEDLDIQGMVDGDAQFGAWAKHHENRNTYDAGIATFLNYLALKAESAARETVGVSPAYTSQRCCECGFIHRDNRDKAKFKCVECGFEEHADIVGARNVKYRGLGVAFKDYDPLDPNITVNST
jgi:putative transposase